VEIGLKALADVDTQVSDTQVSRPATSMLILTVSGLKVLGLILAQRPVNRLTVNNPNQHQQTSVDC